MYSILDISAETGPKSLLTKQINAVINAPVHVPIFLENRGIHDPRLFEGDMILSPRQRYRAEHGLDVDSDRKRGSGTFDRWPGGVVVYAISSALGRFLITVTNQCFCFYFVLFLLLLLLFFCFVFLTEGDISRPPIL